MKKKHLFYEVTVVQKGSNFICNILRFLIRIKVRLVCVYHIATLLKLDIWSVWLGGSRVLSSSVEETVNRGSLVSTFTGGDGQIKRQILLCGNLKKTSNTNECFL